MVGVFAPIYCCEEYLFVQTITFHVVYSFEELGGGGSIEVLPASQKGFVRPLEVGPRDPSDLFYSQGRLRKYVVQTGSWIRFEVLSRLVLSFVDIVVFSCVLPDGRDTRTV